ncbi:MAG: (2Fe-2S)-binding protein [Saprospiraceae bacterium]|nr:(2Fe-2S)-binding protein [Saprospiraceae bacterium]
MPIYKLSINGKEQTVEAPAEMPLLWVLRDLLNMTGTKYGCGLGICGSCMVLVEGDAKTACLLPIHSIQDQAITTIEGLSDRNDHPVQQAWRKEHVPQCGYCQSGQIMRAVALLQEESNPSQAQAEAAMSQVLCRCGTYPRIKKAIQSAIDLSKRP